MNESVRCKYAEIQVLIRYFARVIPASLDTVETLIAANRKEQVKRMALAETKYVVFQDHELEKEATYLNPLKPLVFYCSSGKRSSEAVNLVKKKFPDSAMFSLEGGLKAWESYEL